MYRRRRRPERAVLFSFDSFLDVVANVIGIIMRLILVAWVGARAYKGPPPPDLPSLPELQVPRFSAPADDPALAADLARQQAELARSKQTVMEALREWEANRQKRGEAEMQLSALSQQREAMVQSPRPMVPSPTTGAESLAEILERHRKVQTEVEALRKAPRGMRELAYKLPVSSLVQSEELFLECRAGRVAVVDVGAMVEEIRSRMQEKAQRLKAAWSVEGVTESNGAFRLRYLLERERGLLEGTGLPSERDSFRYGLSSWVVEAIHDVRGETADDALRPGSQLRKVIDGLDPKQTAVTLWVYPDSFALYRQVRDYLHERDLVVAGRPLPVGVPIAMSRKGTGSRGQ